MNHSQTAKYIIVVAFMLLTALAITFERPVKLDARPGIHTELPQHIGAYRGERILFCQNEGCLRSFHESELTDLKICPNCGGMLNTTSLAEKQILPHDTTLDKMLHSKPGSPELFVSIVVTGVEQRSIHRPQQCLPAQGSTIQKSEIITVDGLDDRSALRVAVLETSTRTRNGMQQGFYAYWFVGGGHETPHHIARLFLNAYARVVQKRAPRWAYVAISGNRTPGSDKHLTQLIDFTRILIPELKSLQSAENSK